jgi:hypothetical protein
MEDEAAGKPLCGAAEAGMSGHLFLQESVRETQRAAS